MAKILQLSGEFDRALEEVEFALRLSPRGIDRTYFLYFQAATFLELGRFNEAVATARQSLLLAPQNDEAEYVKIVSLLASGQRQLAFEAMVQFRKNHSPDFQPNSVFDQVFFESAASTMELTSGASLHGLSYNQGLGLIFEDLGWSPE